MVPKVLQKLLTHVSNAYDYICCFKCIYSSIHLYSREHKDRVGEGRALYNLGNVYHAKGKEAFFNVVPDEVSGSLGEDFIVFIALYFFLPLIYLLK